MSKKLISERALVYLVEPIMIALVVILLLALFLPEPGVERNYRLMGLHAQDIAAVVQKSVLVQDGALEGGCGEIAELVEELAFELNPEYRACFRIYGQDECAGCWGDECLGEECNGICASRGWADREGYSRIMVCLD